jgi:uncharacterized membrane protein YozB (DUF420 family)
METQTVFQHILFANAELILCRYAEIIEYHKQAESHQLVKKWTQTTWTAQNC